MPWICSSWKASKCLRRGARCHIKFRGCSGDNGGRCRMRGSAGHVCGREGGQRHFPSPSDSKICTGSCADPVVADLKERRLSSRRP